MATENTKNNILNDQEKDQAYFELCQHLGNMFVSMMVSRKVTFDYVDIALGDKLGTFKRRTMRLLEGKDVTLRYIALVSRALDYRPGFNLKDIRKVEMTFDDKTKDKQNQEVENEQGTDDAQDHAG